MKRLSIILVGILLVVSCGAAISRAANSQSQLGVPSWPAAWLADSAFFDVWARSDGPVAMQAAGRSWLWGPLPFAVANEAYAESPTGKRLVEYLDKGRMEVNDPAADRASNWFVTSGLLVSEMVSGRVQTGNSTFETRAPAEIPVAGDAGSPNAPTYATFARLLGPVPQAHAGLAEQVVSRDGSVRPLEEAMPGAGESASSLGMYDAVSGHNVPAIFTRWMEQSGAVLQGGRLMQGRIMDPLFVLGRPITEAYWAEVLVAGVPTRVLVQLFERRSLTYNPANPPQWQVEMANVGRAYYDWRYGSTAAEPAISAEILPDGVQVRGWNWPAGAQVSAQVEIAGAASPVDAPLEAQSDASGRFNLLIPVGLEIKAALLSGANLRVVVSSGDRRAALPLAAGPSSGSGVVEGILTAVFSAGIGHSLMMKDSAGKEWHVYLPFDEVLSYSEGDEVTEVYPVTGSYARVEGTMLGSRIDARSLRLMSVSRTGARLGYELLRGERGIRVTGTNWPASRDVTFSVRPFSGEGSVQIGSARSDSRGNVAASFASPPTRPAGEPLWLFAQVVEQNSLLAQVAVLYERGEAAEAGRLPALTLLSGDGEQMGGLGSYCHAEGCVEAVGVPVPGANLVADKGEVLGLRSLFGRDPDLGITPQRFTAQLYAYPTEPASEGATMGGTFYFSPRSLPVFSTGEVPGRPFSIALPPAMPGGRYLLLVSVVWTEGAGQREQAVYGFSLLVPDVRPLPW